MTIGKDESSFQKGVDAFFGVCRMRTFLAVPGFPAV